ncbi:Mitogen-activated protein kinase kinase kinase 1 [Leucoagaricus sp. SymC.cos]|nr:Mitogen-activated protein kinase kinase kinase 1 [Leucoagaricus sp. SymC.cos]
MMIGELIISAHTGHKNIVPFYGAYKIQDRFRAHVSPFMELGNLREYLDHYPIAPRIPFIADIISGLNYLHEMDIIHADVKGANVLVSDDRRALLTDFNISRPVMVDEERTSFGTPYWSAPEVLLHKYALPSKASDIWSFACTCYEVISFYHLSLGNDSYNATAKVLTNTAPFHSGPYTGGLYRLIAAMLSRKAIPELPDTLAAYDGTNDDELAKDMRELMLRCWNYEPAERPSASVIKTIISALDYVDNRRAPSLSAAGIGRQVMQSRVDIDYGRVLAVFSKISR